MKIVLAGSTLNIDLVPLWCLCVQVKDLHLDNCRGSEVSGLNSDFIALETLSMINVGLHSLDKFPPLESLRKVSVDITWSVVLFMHVVLCHDINNALLYIYNIYIIYNICVYIYKTG